MEVGTYRLDVAFGSLHMQQLHGFDDLLNDQKVIRNRSAQIDITVATLFIFSASHFSFSISSTSQKKSSE
jgi:hypothetical protein